MGARVCRPTASPWREFAFAGHARVTPCCPHVQSRGRLTAMPEPVAWITITILLLVGLDLLHAWWTGE